jgi:hypothetical protein
VSNEARLLVCYVVHSLGSACEKRDLSLVRVLRWPGCNQRQVCAIHDTLRSQWVRE